MLEQSRDWEKAGLPLLLSARAAGLEPEELLRTYCSGALDDFGDSAACTVSFCEMEGDSCVMEAARLRESYDPGEGSVGERTAEQYEKYLEIGNQLGILGVEAGSEGPGDPEALYFDLAGITVYNTTMLARTVEVTVNGEPQGRFELRRESFMSFLKLDCTKLPADKPVRVEVKIVAVEAQVPDLAILEVWPGLGGSVSGAR